MVKLFKFVHQLLICLLLIDVALAQQGQGRGFQGGRGSGQGFGQGRGQGRGQGQGFRGGQGAQHGHDDRHEEDHEVFQFLLQNHKKITRKVTELKDGVETLTESVDPEIAAKIKEHVEWMEYRIEETNPIRMRDPLFAEIFRHTDKIKMKHEETKNGVRVIETSEDPHVVKLIQAHAKVVSGFVERGFAEAMKNHAVPGKATEEFAVGEFHSPKIDGFGAVVQLPSASEQPKSGSRILVDVTKGGEPDKLLPAIEKVARFVNIYAGAGKEPATAQITVVLHGDATLSVLNSDAYSKRFGTQGNPNFDCLHKLHEAGVRLIVCGQSLTHKKAKPEEVLVFTEVGVSGLTAMVNLQADGYAYVPLK
ncbi:MAG: DsrE family protein [Aureliella sp.]